MTPEEESRRDLDRQLDQFGWLFLGCSEMPISAVPGSPSVSSHDHGRRRLPVSGSKAVVEASTGAIPLVTNRLGPAARPQDVFGELASPIWQYWNTPLLIIAA